MALEKKKQAIALEYDPVEDAPRVLASGTGVLAEKIIEKAKEANVPIHRDDKLADTLQQFLHNRRPSYAGCFPDKTCLFDASPLHFRA